MAKKNAKGYFVRGQFIALGSDLDQEFKLQMKGVEVSKTDLKRQSEELQDLGEELLGLRNDLFLRLDLPESLQQALADARNIQSFGGRRRQMQYIGKLMRRLDDEVLEAIRTALEIQHKGSAEEKQALHLAEQWRENLLVDDGAITQWLQEYPSCDAQHLRALVRQARKDRAQIDSEKEKQEAQGQSPRKSKAFRELFQLVQRQLKESSEQPENQKEFDDLENE